MSSAAVQFDPNASYAPAPSATPAFDPNASYQPATSADPQDSIRQKYGLPATADLSKGFFDPVNKGVNDPQAFTNAYQEFHANDPQPSLWGEIKNWVGHALAPYEGALAPRNAEEMLSPAEMVAGEGALTAGAGMIGDIAEKGLGNTIAETLREPYTGKLKPAIRNPVPFMPRVLQPNIPDWMVPKGETGTITNPAIVPKGQGGSVASGTFYRESPVAIGQTQPEVGSPENPAYHSKLPARLTRAQIDALNAQASATTPRATSSGVSIVPEPNAPAPGEKPGTMYSVPRSKLFAAALRGKPGAADVLRDLGVPQVVIPHGADIESPLLPMAGDLPNARKLFQLPDAAD